MKHNEENERIKRAYRLHMKAARGLSDASIDVASAAIHRFEKDSAFRSFKKLTLSRPLRSVAGWTMPGMSEPAIR
jgi:hypothetical protein